MKKETILLYYAVIYGTEINSRRALQRKCVFICCLELEKKIKCHLLETMV